MRHKYETRGIVLSRSPLGEANAFVTLLTPELGLVRARAQGVRRSGAKLSAARVLPTTRIVSPARSTVWLSAFCHTSSCW